MITTQTEEATAPAISLGAGLEGVKEIATRLPSAVTAGVMEFSDEEIKERMSGNLCRCGAYIGICEAIREAFQAEVSR